MTIYLFVLMGFSVLRALVLLACEEEIAKRVGCILGIAISLPAFVWFGWYSGLLF